MTTANQEEWVITFIAFIDVVFAEEGRGVSLEWAQEHAHGGAATGPLGRTTGLASARTAEKAGKLKKMRKCNLPLI